MSTPNEWAIADVAEATAYKISTGVAMFQLKNLKVSGLDNTAKIVYARGGRGNAKIVGFSSDREAKVKLEDAVFTNAVLAMMTGNDLITGATNYFKAETLTVATNSVSLTKTPVGAVLTTLYKLNVDGSYGLAYELVASAPTAGEYTLASKLITFSTGDLADGSLVQAFYNVVTDATAVKLKVSADKFAGSFKLVLDCLVTNIFDKQQYAAQITIHTCKAEDNWSFNFQAGGEPSVFTMPLEVLKPATGQDMWEMVIFDEGLAV